MGRPITRHKDTAQIGVVGKRNAEKIVDLALIPVRGRPDTRHSWHGRVLFTALSDLHLQTHKTLIIKREKLIHDIEAWNTIKPVDRRHRLKKIVVEFLFEIRTN